MQRMDGVGVVGSSYPNCHNNFVPSVAFFETSVAPLNGSIRQCNDDGLPQYLPHWPTLSRLSCH